ATWPPGTEGPASGVAGGGAGEFEHAAANAQRISANEKGVVPLFACFGVAWYLITSSIMPRSRVDGRVPSPCGCPVIVWPEWPRLVRPWRLSDRALGRVRLVARER